MRGLWSSAGKDVRRQLRDPFAIALWCGLPLLIASLMTLAFGGSGAGGGPALRARLLVVDEDKSIGSRLLTGALGQAGGLIVVEPVEGAVGLRRITAGEGSALLVIPKGFAAAVLAREPQTLELVTNPSQRILPAILEQTLSMIVEGVFYLQEVLATPLGLIAEGQASAEDPTSAQVADVAVRINEAIKAVSSSLNPPLLQVETRLAKGTAGPAAGAAQAQPGFGLLFFPGTLLMALVFVAQGMSEDLWREKEQGTLRRVLGTPCPVSAFLAGKFLAASVFFALVSALALAVGTALLGLPLPRLPLALAWSVGAGAALLALFVTLQMLGSTRRGASVLTNMVMFPLLMIGGSFFPFEIMPPWMAAAGRHTPNGWALSVLKEILAGPASAFALLAPAAGLLLVGAALFAFSARRLRRFAR